MSRMVLSTVQTPGQAAQPQSAQLWLQQQKCTLHLTPYTLHFTAVQLCERVAHLVRRGRTEINWQINALIYSCICCILLKALQYCANNSAHLGVVNAVSHGMACMGNYRSELDFIRLDPHCTALRHRSHRSFTEIFGGTFWATVRLLGSGIEYSCFICISLLQGSAIGHYWVQFITVKCNIGYSAVVCIQAQCTGYGAV